MLYCNLQPWLEPSSFPCTSFRHWPAPLQSGKGGEGWTTRLWALPGPRPPGTTPT